MRISQKDERKNRFWRPLGYYGEYQHVCNEFRKEKGKKKDAVLKYLQKKKRNGNSKILENMNRYI